PLGAPSRRFPYSGGPRFRWPVRLASGSAHKARMKVRDAIRLIEHDGWYHVAIHAIRNRPWAELRMGASSLVESEFIWLTEALSIGVRFSSLVLGGTTGEVDPGFKL
ncbi:MAG: hypothetical protein ACREDY_15050, partial [Bradyrhizobium sp.]